jgi:hypothetical protein
LKPKAKDKSACQTHLGETPAKSPLVLKIGLQHLGDTPADEPLLKGDCEQLVPHFHSGPLSDRKKFWFACQISQKSASLSLPFLVRLPDKPEVRRFQVNPHSSPPFYPPIRRIPPIRIVQPHRSPASFEETAPEKSAVFSPPSRIRNPIARHKETDRPVPREPAHLRKSAKLAAH